MPKLHGEMSSADGREELRTTCWAYRSFDEVVRLIEAKVAQNCPKLPLCNEVDVAKRVVQRIVEITADDFVESLKPVGFGTEHSTSRKGNFSAKGINIQLASGEVAISTRRMANELTQFLIAWSYIVLRLFVAIFKNQAPVSTGCTILLEPGGNWLENDCQFVEFLRKGPIRALSKATKIIVCAVTAPASRADIGIAYDRYPLLYLVDTSLTRADRILALLFSLTAPLIVLKTIANNKLNVLLAKETAWLPLVRFLDRGDLIEAIVGTTSSFGSQPIWVKGIKNQRFRYHMVWYSQNFVPKLYKGESLAAALPSARHMRVDVHWVWTEGFQRYLRGLDQRGEIHVVGPILWYLPETAPANNANISVAVFDVTPLPEGVQAFGSYKNYYSPHTIKKFILDIVSICRDLEAKNKQAVRVLLKHKRPPVSGRHDIGYLQFIDSLHETYPNFVVLPEQSNLFQILSSAAVSVSVPYTSTCYVAASLKKHGIYYDPYGELEPIFEPSPYVHFAADKEGLRSLIELSIDRQTIQMR